MKIKYLLGMAVLTVGLISCKREGCTNIDATNFDSEAKNDNGTCTFEGNMVFWYGEDVANFLYLDDAVSLTYYVDNQIVGSSAASIYWGGTSPGCGTNGLVTVTKKLGNVETQAYSYKVIDQSGWTYWDGTLNFNANSCFALELD